MTEPNLWAVVHDGATRYIGQVLTKKEDNVFDLVEAFELLLLRMPQPTREGVVVATAVHPMPIGLAAGFTKISVKATAVERFSDMDEIDRRKYEQLIADVRKSFLAQRAEAAGISLATTIPKGAR